MSFHTISSTPVSQHSLYPQATLPAQKEPIKPLSQSFSALGQGLVFLVQAGGSYLVILVLRITAKALSVFGDVGQRASKSLRAQARKIKALYVIHRFIDLLPAKLPHLARTRNIARRECIRNEEDVAAAQKLRDQIVSKVSEPTIAQILQEIEIKGAKSSGICEGASLWFIQAVLKANVNSQEELQKIAKECEEGFPAEAAAVHELEGRGRDKLIVTVILVVLIREATGFKQMLSEKGRHEQLIKKYENFNGTSLQLLKTMHELDKGESFVSHLLQMCSEPTDKIDLAGFETNEDAKSRFDLLPLGNYKLEFRSTEKSGHVIAYLKLEFGSYMMDPNVGLMKCESSQDLSALLQKIYPLKDPATRYFTATRYSLAP